jgi:hypothetical protein
MNMNIIYPIYVYIYLFIYKYYISYLFLDLFLYHVDKPPSPLKL